MNGLDQFKDDIDWSVYKKQQTPKSIIIKDKNIESTEPDNSDVEFGTDPKNPMVNTFLGKLPKNYDMLHDKKLISEMINAYAGNPGIQMLGKAAPIAKNVAGYLSGSRAGKEAEAFRGDLGQGTSTQNIDELSKRIQFAKKSAKEEALIPKREVYKTAGKSDVYDVNPAKLPEGNLEKFGQMIDPESQFSPPKMEALSKALKTYRKSGNVDAFLEHSEDLFNIPELTDKQAAKIEDVLSMPTKRNSTYFAEDGVTDYYGKKGELLDKHSAFQEKPTLNNYDKLQSALKKEIRKLDKREKAGTITDEAEAKLGQFKANVKNLDNDKEAFMQTLPEKMQNLETEFRTKYAQGVGKYEDAGEGARKIIKKLASGKSTEVTPAQINRIFSRPTDEVKRILQDLGSSAGRNILYNALLKVPEGDAESMATTLLDLKKTKGFDQFVTPEMENWANGMLKRIKTAKMVKQVGAPLAGAAGGFMMGGVPGAVVGAALPYANKVPSLISKYLKR